jgi:mRNA interferase RelE/StbE
MQFIKNFLFKDKFDKLNIEYRELITSLNESVIGLEDFANSDEIIKIKLLKNFQESESYFFNSLNSKEEEIKEAAKKINFYLPFANGEIGGSSLLNFNRYKNGISGEWECSVKEWPLNQLLLNGDPAVSPPPPPRVDNGVRYSLRFSLAVPDVNDTWQSIFTKPFKKAVKILDKNLQGRIHNAILEILESPTNIKGDTIKPLTGELAGYWRYRLGDYRLVYFPKIAVQKILFMDVGARGGIYE